ncbi:MAG: ABC transporter permease [Lachnospiraceae bacterium]|nr:ABC transporter permease [Lachnospiraceae bacterium]
MKVGNRKCVSRLAGRMLFANRRRNLITVCAIILTAVLFTSLFTIMLSINASYENSTFRQLGGKVHGTFKDVTEAQEEKLVRHPNIKAYGERMILGMIAEDPFLTRSAEISYMDANTSEWSFIELKEGHLPAGEKEVVMDEEALRLLGHEPVLGESIELSFDLVGVPSEDMACTDTFTLAGYWEFDPLCPVHFINVSKEYVLNYSGKLEKMGYEPIRIDVDVMLSSSVNAGDKMVETLEDCGYTYGEVSSDDTVRIGVNPGYTGSSLGGEELLEMALPLGAFLLLVIFTGYLIIYNVFQISVVSDIRFYGLLKTIGTTRKQIRRLVRLQALALCLVGIPAGLLLGYLLGAVLTPTVLATTTISRNSLSISSSPVIFLAAAVFEIITVLLSVSKPGRMAGKVSPMEALRFQDGYSGGKARRTTRGARARQMAFANMTRNKKKTILVFASLALSLVLLNSVNLFVGGFDLEKWISASTSSDFVVGKYQYFKFAGAREDALTLEEIQRIKEDLNVREGGIGWDVRGIPVMQVSEGKYREYYESQPGAIPIGGGDGSYYLNCSIEGMDASLLDKLEVCEGDLSPLKDPDARAVAVITHRYDNGTYSIDENAPKIGDRIRLAVARSVDFVDSRTGETATEAAYGQPEYLRGDYIGMTGGEYTVCAYVEVPSDISLRYGSLSYDLVALSDLLREDLGDSVVPVFYAFDTESPEEEAQAESYLHDLSEANRTMSYESKAVKRADFEGFRNMFLLLGGVLCGIIGFVGVLNFLNTVLAGILARKNELAVLQAIGMTGRQVKEMLILEGMIYTAGSGLMALSLSLIFVPAVNAVAGSLVWFYSPYFSLTPVLLVLPILVLLGVLVPLASYRGISRASIVDRIREIG